MTIGEIVTLKSMPEEKWEVISQRGDQFCLKNVDEPRLAIWAREDGIQRDRNITIADFIKSKIFGDETNAMSQV